MQIPDAHQVMARYPFELSGGMRQRVMIALAFSCEPELIIADEPTTALDVTVQLQVLRLLKHKARASGTSVLFISHDMAVVSQLCDRMYVMYAGSVIESGATQTLIHAPSSLLHWPAEVCAGERSAARSASGHPRHRAQPQPASAGMRIPRSLLCRRGEMQRNPALTPMAQRANRPPAGIHNRRNPCLMYCWNWIACT
jgi:peptide/nickel transport system ATP-binding protein